MSTQLQKTLEKLNSLKKKGSTSKSEGQKFAKFYKPKDKEKNNIIFLTFPKAGDPFAFYHQHANILPEPGKTVPCKQGNLNERCVICETVASLKAEDWKGNYPVWNPIEAKIRFYSPIVDLDNIDAGVQYWGYGQSVMKQLETWLENLEDDEKEFYNIEDVQKIIVNFDKSLSAMEMYKLDKKALKGVEKAQIAEWQSQVQELSEITKNFYKSEEEEEFIVQKYLERTIKKIKESEGDSEAGEDTEQKASVKLTSLKKGE